MNIVRNIIAWVLWSSENSDKISLTLKAGIPFLVLWGIGDSQTLTSLVGNLGQGLMAAGQLVAAIMTSYGLARKIWNTYR